MSCPTHVFFENNKEGTRKNVFVNLGWVSPTSYQLMRILVEAESQISTTYEWDTLSLPISELKMSREHFELASMITGEISTDYKLQKLFDIWEFCE